jgi:hypothetical protein
MSIATIFPPAIVKLNTTRGRPAFDPRQLTAYTYFRIQPQRLQAWREADEIADRELIAAGSGSSP